MSSYATLVRLIRDATTAGKALLTAANAAAQRTLLGLGTSAVRDDSYFAIADTHAHTVINLDGTSIVDMDGNGNTRITTASGKGIILAPLNDTVSVIRGTAQPQTWQIANTWSASDNFELLRIMAANTEYDIGSVPGSASGSNRPIKFGHFDGSGVFTAAVTIATNGTVSFANAVSLPSGSTIADYQPIDSDLTAIAALTTTSFGRGSLTVADATAFRTYIGAGTGTSNFDGAYSSLSGIPSTFTPSSHAHGNITNAGAIGSTANLPLITTASGVITVGAFGTTANTFCQGDDSRLSDARTPSSHTHPLSQITQSSASTNQVPQWDGSAWVPVTLSSGSGDALTSNPLSQFAATTSTQLRGVMSDETGSNLLVFNTSPALVTPTMDLITLTETLGPEMVVDGGFAAPTQYTCATAGVNITNDTFTLSSDPGWSVNDVVQYFNGGGTAATGMVHRGFYFIESYSAGVITVKTTTGGAKVNITGTGNNAQFFIKTNWFAGTSGTTGGVDSWDLSAGRAAKQVAGTATLRPVTALAPTPGTLYKITYDVSNWSVAGTTLVFGGGTAQAATAPTANGTVIHYVTALTNGDLLLVPVTGMRADIDNLSIKPVLSGITSTAVPINISESLTNAVTNEAAFTLNYTVNKSGGNDTGLQINMNDVASPGTSICFQINVGSTSAFSVQNNGTIVTAGGITCTSITASATISTSTVISTSYAGTASTACIRTSGAILTGGTGTTNFPQWLQQPTAATAVTTWSTAGTWWGVNTASGFTGNFIDCHVNGGTTLFGVDSTGKITAAGGVDPRVDSVASSATPSPNFQTHDQYQLTALAADATFAAPAGTLVNGMPRFIRIKDNGTARLLTWNAAYRAIGVTLPTTTTINKTLYLGMKYNSADSKWDVLAVGVEA